MKKLLLIFFVAFGLIGLANAESEWNYYCEVEDSVIYNYTEQTLIEPKPTNLFFNIDRNRVLGFGGSPFNITDTSEFIINDYEDYQNFNATLANEKDIYSNLTYQNGSLALTWLYKDSASIGVYFANCTEEGMFVLYEPVLVIEMEVPVFMCGDLVVDFDKPDKPDKPDVREGKRYVAKPVLINLEPDDPICIEAEKNK
jgi:hypothetical protein